MRGPKKPYLAAIVWPLLEFSRWLLEQAASQATWWRSIPFDSLLRLLAAFMVGLLVADLANKESWIWANVRQWRRLFEIEGVIPVHKANEQREWLEVTVRLRFVRAVTDIQLLVRVDANMNLRHARERFVLCKVPLQQVSPDEQMQVVIAVLPLARHDGQPLGYQCWGERFRESGDVAEMRGLSAGTDNLVDIEAMGGRWFRQRERVFLSALQTQGGTFGRLFIATDGEPAALGLTLPG